MKERSFTILQ